MKIIDKLTDIVLVFLTVTHQHLQQMLMMREHSLDEKTAKQLVWKQLSWQMMKES